MSLYSHICASCGRRFQASRPDAETCGVACRQRRSRERAAARAVASAADLLQRQTAAVIALTSTDDEAERDRLRGVLLDLAAEAERTLPRAA